MAAWTLVPQSGAATRPSRAPAPAPSPTITLLVDLSRATKVGPRRAGMLCMPNGAMRVVDLVGDDAGLEATLRQALVRARFRPGQSLDLHVTAIAVRLCARKWGAFGIGGDRKALSGQARYDFTWRRGAEPVAHPASIALDVPADAPLTAGEITGLALDRLLAQITPPA